LGLGLAEGSVSLLQTGRNILTKQRQKAITGLMLSSAVTWVRQHRITKFPNRTFEPNASSTKTGHRGECGTYYVYSVASFYIFWLTSKIF